MSTFLFTLTTTRRDEGGLFAELTRAARSLGHEVHVLIVLARPCAGPHEDDREQRTIDAVVRLVHERRVDVLFPLGEETFLFAKHRERIPCRMLLNDAAVYETLHRKRLAPVWAQAEGIPHVPTLVLGTTTTDEEIAGFAGASRPVFLKEDVSQGGWGTHAFASVADLGRFLVGRERARYVVQPHAPGPYWVAQGVFRDGELVDADVLRPASVWNDDGLARLAPFPRTSHDRGALDLLMHVAARTRYRGLLEIECLGPSGSQRIVDINPRCGGGVTHSALTGSSLCENAIRAHLDERPARRRAGRGVSKIERIGYRHFPRQWEHRPWSVLDPTRLVRWAWLEACARRTERSAPCRAVPSRPASVTVISPRPTAMPRA